MRRRTFTAEIGSAVARSMVTRARRSAWPVIGTITRQGKWKWICVLGFLLGAAAHVSADEPKRILLLHSFGRDFAPWNEYSKEVRKELDQQIRGPVDIYEASLATARSPDDNSDRFFAGYLRSLSGNHELDLAISIGAPAAAFFQKYRKDIAPTTPMLLAAVEQRGVSSRLLTEKDAVVSINIDIGGVIANILGILPETKNIVIVIGNSPIEQFWQAQTRAAVPQYSDRVAFTWFNDLSFEEMLTRSQSLPRRSAIFFALLSVDAAGVPHEEGKALDRLHAVANAPIFSYVDAYFGRGIVGGPLISVTEASSRAVNVAVRLLQGESAKGITTEPVGSGRPRFDWRELKRWDIAEAGLPIGSVVEFRVPTVFEQYKLYILAAAAVCLVEACLIIGLLVQRARLRREHTERMRAERAARDLSDRLISAQEDERSRLARELHDDVTQRLALLAIDASCAEQKARDGSHETLRSMRDGLVKLSEDVHALSYRLHPSILDDLGLVEALNAECQRFSRYESLAVNISVHDRIDAVPREIALCLFRIVQEALRNIGRHAKAGSAEVSLRLLDNGLQLRVGDDGVGFDPKGQRERPSLGLASMQQRIYQLGGQLDIESALGRGTTVSAWVPWREEHRETPARAFG